MSFAALFSSVFVCGEANVHIFHMLKSQTSSNDRNSLKSQLTKCFGWMHIQCM